jgi:tetratricopeptide (TPR) repeat protein
MNRSSLAIILAIAAAFSPTVYAEDAGDLWKAGAALLDSGDSKGALAKFDAAIAMNPNFGAAHEWRARVYNMQGRYKEGYEEMAVAIRCDPSNANAFIIRGQWYGCDGRWEDAVVDYAAALPNIPADDKDRTSYTYFLRGAAYGVLGQHRRAVEYYGSAIAVITFARAVSCRGASLCALGEYEAALKDYDQSVAMDGKNPYTFFFRGDCYVYLGQYDKAVADYGASLAAFGDKPDARVYYDRGMSYFLMGKKAEAAADFAKSKTLSPDDRRFEPYAKGSRPWMHY